MSMFPRNAGMVCLKHMSFAIPSVTCNSTAFYISLYCHIPCPYCNVQEPPSCKAARKQCSDDATCSAIFEAWKTACADLKEKRAKKCPASCTAAGSLLRQNILGSRTWQCLKGDNKAMKTKFMKLCLY